MQSNQHPVRGLVWPSVSALLFVCGCGSASPDGGDTAEHVGEVKQATTLPPFCQTQTYNGTSYQFCNSLVTWPSARDACRALGDYQLARVNDAGEAAFIGSKAGILTWWIGANDRDVEGDWRWPAMSSDAGDLFWRGNATGSAAPGMFANWIALEPDNVANQDCGVTDLTGKWRDQSCGLLLAYVCKHNPLPDSNCTTQTYNGHTYWTCSNPRSWQDARSHCQSLAGGDLVQIDTKAEADFVGGMSGGVPRWIGASDQGTEGQWKWMESGTPFWAGDSTGKVVPGQHAGWASAQPDNSGEADCARAGGAAGWTDEPCATQAPFVCESRPAPDPSCTFAVRNQHEYWFCPTAKTWEAARDACRSEDARDLARIDDAGENAFVQSHITSKSWLGGTDRADERTWRWLKRPLESGDQFWSGAANGTATFAYAKWSSGQPDNNGNQDCLAMDASSGSWVDERCGTTQGYACETQSDQCPNDPLKRMPGICGCGVPDVDTDGDGTFDCNEQCPRDPMRTTRGQCGCVGEPNPAAQGTPCSDGLCPANNACDGHGSCGQPQQCAPALGCTASFFNREAYWSCPALVTWNTARDLCRTKPRTQLTQVDTPAENIFVQQHLSGVTWLGGNDLSVKSKWRWPGTNSNDGTVFWTGTASGTAPKGRYANWRSDQPSILGDCASMDPFDAGEWRASGCLALAQFTCETCIPKTCSDLGAQCGTQSDGCGGTLNCGTCSGGKVCFAGVGICSDAGGNDCRRAVKLDPSLPTEDAARKMFTQLAFCTQPNLDPCVAQFEGETRADLVHASSLCMQTAMVAGMHNAVMRDRDRKARNARHNPASYCQIAGGDGDKDHIPDAIDQCPESPPLTPTTDTGCPDPTPLRGPSNDIMAWTRDHLITTNDPSCAGSLALDRPQGLILETLPHAMAVGVHLPTNQPTGCPLYFEFIMSGMDPSGKPVYFHMGFLQSEGQTVFTPVGSINFIVNIDPNGTQFANPHGDRGAFVRFTDAAAGKYAPHLAVTARIINGAGRQSDWVSGRFGE